MPLAVGLNDSPRGVWRGGAVQHLLAGVAVVPHLLPIPPVLIGDLPLLVGHFLTLLKTTQLLFGVDVEPELEQDCSEVRPLLLHPIDFPIRPPPLCLRAEPLHPLDQHAAVPRPVEDRSTH